MTQEANLIAVPITKLIGKNVAGLKAQIVEPKYLDTLKPKWRVLTHVKNYTERGVEWVELYWERGADDSCNFTGTAIKVNCVSVQFTQEDYERLGL